MDRSAAQRVRAVREWRANPRNKGKTPPVEVMAPGLAARPRATRAQLAEVQALLRQHHGDLVNLEASQMRQLLPVLRRAQDDLARKLKTWTEKAPDGTLRFTAYKYRAALVQLEGIATELEKGMFATLDHGGRAAQSLGVAHLTNEVARFSAVFGDPVPVQLNLAATILAGRGSLVERFRSSAERYAWGRKLGVYNDLKTRLASQILQGASVYEMVDDLQLHGGPRGLVALQGIAGEEGAVIELIPEGLFARYRSRAETYVRTELAGAYSEQYNRGLHHAAGILPDLEKRWCSEGGCKEICDPADGQTVAVNEEFVLGDGTTADFPPAHPRCRCRHCAWRPHWDAMFASLGID